MPLVCRLSILAASKKGGSVPDTTPYVQTSNLQVPLNFVWDVTLGKWVADPADPVTVQMLRTPDPRDWLMIRRNYQAWSYSPLSQITNQNVRELRLAWVWAMNDSGTSETSPIVHNGIIYLVSPSHIVQALDGKTGNLIWETHAGPYQAPGGSGSGPAARPFCPPGCTPWAS